MNGYKLDLANKTLTITKAFADAAAKSTASEEYRLFTQLQHDIQGLRIVQKTHRTPDSYTTRDGETYRCNQFKNLTYDHMEAFINELPNNEKFIEAYSFLRYSGGAVQTNRYAAVRRWFVAQFPYYRKNPLFYLRNDVDIIDITQFITPDKKNPA